ncbi:MAG: hypothetical protein IKV20_05135 [Clostridia bacterium]|nr:hypothetical protein [Clostridia bacterium]
MDIKQRKKQLINERVFKSAAVNRGRRAVSRSVLAIFFLRLVLFILDVSLLPTRGIKVGAVSHIFSAILLLVLYMIFDGNRGLTSLLSISAIVRVIVYFSGIHPEVIEAGLGAYTGVFLAVMLLQFLISVLISSATVSQSYFKVMQEINLQLRKEMIGKR